MLDILRRLIGGETRPVDLWIIVIELLVLAIILLDSIWDKAHKFSEWRNTRREAKQISVCLAMLTEQESSALRNMILLGRQPAYGMDLQSKFGTPYVIELTSGIWQLTAKHRALIEKWAQRY